MSRKLMENQMLLQESLGTRDNITKSEYIYDKVPLSSSTFKQDTLRVNSGYKNR